MKLFVSIDQKWLENNKKVILDEQQAEDPSEERAELNLVLSQDVDPDKCDIEIADGQKKIKFSVWNLDFGYAELTVSITDSFLLQIFEIAVKRMNKMRTAIEALR